MNLSPDGIILKNRWDNYNFKFSKDYKASDIKKSLFQNRTSIKSIKEDLFGIKYSNIDRQHPVLYYSLFRIWNTGYDGLSPQEGIYRGCYFNLLTFCLSFFFMFKLLNLLKPNDKKFISLGLFFSSFCTAGISDNLLIREYSIAGLFFVICSYLTVLICKNIIDNKNISFKFLLLISFIYSLLAQTGYFSIIYNGILAITLIGFCLFVKNFKFLKTIFILILLTFLWINIIYPDYFYYMFNNEHSALNANNINILNILLSIIKKIFYFLGHFIIYKTVFYFIVLLIPFKIFKSSECFTKKEHLFLLILIFTAILHIIFILFILEFSHIENQYIRFLLPTSSILSLLLVYITYKFKNIYIYLILLLYLIISVNPSNIIYMHNDCESPKNIQIKSDTTIQKLISDGVLQNNNLKTFQNKNFKISEKIPVVIVHPEFFYTFDYFAIINNNCIIRFENTIPDNNYKFNKFILYSYPLEKIHTTYKKKSRLHYSNLDNRSIYYIEIK